LILRNHDHGVTIARIRANISNGRGGVIRYHERCAIKCRNLGNRITAHIRDTSACIVQRLRRRNHFPTLTLVVIIFPSFVDLYRFSAESFISQYKTG
jgi:hypothetical protein